jgi:predicted esterase
MMMPPASLRQKDHAMPRGLFHLLLLLPAPFLLTACGPTTTPPRKAGGEGNGKPVTEQPKGNPRPVEKPVAPLQLPVPSALPERLDGKDLKAMPAAELLARANQAMAREDYSRAAAFQYWHVQKSGTGQYNLACFLAQIGRTDPAFYWLQRAAIEEGVDTQHAQRDEDLVSLRRDPRWAQVRQYLVDCNRYFESGAISRTVLVLPKGYRKGTPIPAVLWLHGLGSRPDDFVNSGCQDLADRLNLAFIGVSGTKARGPRSFVWAEDPEKDARRIRDALAEVSDRVTVKKGHVITFGFSQGAQVGLDVAVRSPEEYAGSIVLSPGAEPHLDDVKPSPLLAWRAFVLCCGAKEHPGNVELTAQDAAWLRRAKAQVLHKAYPGVSAHAFPRDFNERFPEWVTFILKRRDK